MHTTFVKAADQFVSVNKQANNAFGNLSDYAYAVIKDKLAALDTEGVVNVLKSTIGADENEYKAAHPRLKEFPPTYRSAKSVIMSAVKAGVSLVDDKGQRKGKTELEQETKEAKGEKSAIDKFQSAIATATAIFAKMDNVGDVRKAKALLTVLADSVVKAEKAMVEAEGEALKQAA
jgi:hypothetical protein